MATYAYLRVSSRAQAEANGTQAQRAAITQWGAVDEWFEDAGISGKFMDRPAWVAMNAKLLGGDTVVAYDISRCARNVEGLLGWVRDMRERGVRVVLLKDNVDLDTLTGKLMLTVLGAVAEWQRAMNAEKVRDGMARGKANGARYGAPIRVPHEVIEQARARIAQGEPVGVVAKDIGMHRNGLGKRLKKLVKDAAKGPDAVPSRETVTD